jgi:hypothetical protein
MTGSSSLIVMSIGADEVVEAGSVGLEDHGHGNGCRATWAIVGGHTKRIQVMATRDADPKQLAAPSTCPLDGTHRYHWTGTALVLAD